MCSNTSIYTTNMSETPNCKCCKKPLSPNCERNMHEECRQRMIMTHKNARENRIPCGTINANGTACAYMANTENGNGFCNRHRMNQLQDDPIDIIRCCSRYQCNANEPGVKMVLPHEYPYSQCENCRNRLGQ